MNVCQYCNEDYCDGVQSEVIDPYIAEIHGETVYVWMCDGAYQQSCDDI